MSLPSSVTRHGGAREGAGRKPKALADEAADRAQEAGYLDYAIAKAKKETYLAELAQLEFEVKTQAKIDRIAVREAAAAAQAACAQALRAIPDTVERKFNVAPEIAAEIGLLIDAAMDELATELERMGRDGF